MGPRDLVGAEPKWSSLSTRSRASIVSISAFLETNAASASSFDLTICFRVRVLIFDLQLDRRPDECFFPCD